MRKGTKIAIVAGVLAVAGAAGVSSMAIAEYKGHRGHHAGKHHGGHHGWGHHRGWSKKRGWRMHKLMDRFDSNEDGKLTQAEIDEARKALLARHDTDKDGKLSLAEYEKLWLEVMRRRMVRGFQRTDTDGDAAVTIDEFLKPYSRLVERMDRNEDGVLDKEDRKRHHWRHHRGDDDKKGMEKRGG